MSVTARNPIGADMAPISAAQKLVLSVEDLVISVKTEDGLRPLVKDLSFDLHRGETLAIAGESGSGKSLTSLAIMKGRK